MFCCAEFLPVRIIVFFAFPVDVNIWFMLMRTKCNFFETELLLLSSFYNCCLSSLIIVIIFHSFACLDQMPRGDSWIMSRNRSKITAKFFRNFSNFLWLEVFCLQITSKESSGIEHSNIPKYGLLPKQNFSLLTITIE